jgi:hypothetical protein
MPPPLLLLLLLLVSSITPTRAETTPNIRSEGRHFIIVTQARSLSTLLDELLRRRDLNVHSYGELFNPKGFQNNTQDEEYAWIAGPNGEIIPKSLAYAWNERHGIFADVLLTPDVILTETIGFFESHRGNTGYKLLYEQVGRPTPLELVALEQNLTVPEGMSQLIVGRRRRPRDKELVLPHFHYRLFQRFGDVKMIFLVRDFFDSAISNYEARVLNAWAFLKNHKKSAKLLRTKIKISTPDDVSNLLKMLSFTCSINLQLQREYEWFHRHEPSSAKMIIAEELRNPTMRGKIIAETLSFLLERKVDQPATGTPILSPTLCRKLNILSSFFLEKGGATFTNEQGRSSIPMEERIEDWGKIRVMIPTSAEWVAAKIQPECRELIQKRFSQSSDVNLHASHGGVTTSSQEPHRFSSSKELELLRVIESLKPHAEPSTSTNPLPQSPPKSFFQNIVEITSRLLK